MRPDTINLTPLPEFPLMRIDRICEEIYWAVIAREYEQRLADENRRLENQKLNQAFIENIVAIENAGHRRQN
jgi:hypothetical protein